MEESSYKKLASVLVAVVIVFIIIAGFTFYYCEKKTTSSENNNIAISGEINTTSTTSNTVNNKEIKNNMENTFDKNKNHTAILHTTDGDITIEFTSQATPVTVENFVNLAKKGFYDNTIFHRVIKGFMIQGGDPTGTGMGGPGYKFDDEPFVGEYTRGTVAMANAGPNTNGSQFFIMHTDVPLPKNYVIFGKVTKGLDVVDKIATAPVKASQSGENSSPVEPVKINSVEVLEK
jgi:cyclophilin family peptidyl-prolyl cis-trans isomerase